LLTVILAGFEIIIIVVAVFKLFKIFFSNIMIADSTVVLGFY